MKVSASFGKRIQSCGRPVRTVEQAARAAKMRGNIAEFNQWCIVAEWTGSGAIATPEIESSVARHAL